MTTCSCHPVGAGDGDTRIPDARCEVHGLGQALAHTAALIATPIQVPTPGAIVHADGSIQTTDAFLASRAREKLEEATKILSTLRERGWLVSTCMYTHNTQVTFDCDIYKREDL